MIDTPEAIGTVKRTYVENFYESLKEMENREPQGHDPIRVALITPQSPEYQKLKSAGVTEEELAEKSIPRHKLLSAGFVFVNRMYLPLKFQDMEKPIFSGEINGIDFSKKTLLTQEELDAIRSASKSDLPQDIIDEVRLDMLSFQLNAKYDRHINLKNYANLLNMILDYVKQKKGDEFVTKLEDKFKEELKIPKDEWLVYSASEIFSKYCKDILPWEDVESALSNIVRNINVSYKPGAHREQTLTGVFSPYLKSGFQFPSGINLDTSLHLPGQEVRLNLMNWHLAGLGLSELGDSIVGAHDQHYLTIQEYYDLFFKDKDKSGREERRENESKQVEYTMTKSEEEIIDELVDRFISLIEE